MAMQPSFTVPTDDASDGTTGRYIVTFRDGASKEGLAAMKKSAGVQRMASAADFAGSAVDFEKMDKHDGTHFPTLGIAVAQLDEEAAGRLMAATDDDSAILAIEPERMFYALGTGLTASYLGGYRDAVNHLYDKASRFVEDEEARIAAAFADDGQSTWGLKATRATASTFTGKGIRVAVLDTGFDLLHPDFRGRPIVSKSFIAGQTVQDGQGHGTHCVGTSCGRKDANGRRYGVAGDASIHVGKVLSNAGSGATSGILAGMEWAIVAKCQVISMSLGNTVSTPSVAYENVGRRALNAGSLIVAAAGNHRQTGNPAVPGTVAKPANSPSIMAVAAVDSRLGLASFSCTSGGASGAKVDIAAPGVAVYSSVRMPTRYATFNGTSMATPHVAGVAALWSQATGATGWRLWQTLTSRASGLQLSAADVGSGLVQAP